MEPLSVLRKKKKKKNGNVGGISELAESCSKLVGFLKKKEKV